MKGNKDFIQNALSFESEKDKLDFSCDIVQTEFIHDLKKKLGILNTKNQLEIKSKKKLLARRMKMSVKQLDRIFECEERVDISFMVKLMWATGIIVRIKINQKSVLKNI